MGIKGVGTKNKGGLLISYSYYFVEGPKNPFIGDVYGNIVIPSSDPVQSMGDLPSDSELSMN